MKCANCGHNVVWSDTDWKTEKPIKPAYAHVIDGILGQCAIRCNCGCTNPVPASQSSKEKEREKRG